MRVTNMGNIEPRWCRECGEPPKDELNGCSHRLWALKVFNPPKGMLLSTVHCWVPSRCLQVEQERDEE